NTHLFDRAGGRWEFREPPMVQQHVPPVDLQFTFPVAASAGRFRLPAGDPPAGRKRERQTEEIQTGRLSSLIDAVDLPDLVDRFGDRGPFCHGKDAEGAFEAEEDGKGTAAFRS